MAEVPGFCPLGGKDHLWDCRDSESVQIPSISLISTRPFKIPTHLFSPSISKSLARSPKGLNRCCNDNKFDGAQYELIRRLRKWCFSNGHSGGSWINKSMFMWLVSIWRFIFILELCKTLGRILREGRLYLRHIHGDTKTATRRTASLSGFCLVKLGPNSKSQFPLSWLQIFSPALPR